MSDARDIIIRPIVSEKSYGLLDAGVYTFVDIRGAVVAAQMLAQLNLTDATPPDIAERDEPEDQG